MIKTYILTAALSLIPISELRGAIPYGYFNGLSMPVSMLIAIVFNAAVYPIALIFLQTIHTLLYKWNFYKNFFDKTLKKARNKVEGKIQTYGVIGLALFVAIPLPVTGAWTGSLVAWALGLDKKKSFAAILLGVLIASIIICAVCLAGKAASSVFIKTL